MQEVDRTHLIWLSPNAVKLTRTQCSQVGENPMQPGWRKPLDLIEPQCSQVDENPIQAGWQNPIDLVSAWDGIVLGMAGSSGTSSRLCWVPMEQTLRKHGWWSVRWKFVYAVDGSLLAYVYWWAIQPDNRKNSSKEIYFLVLANLLLTMGALKECPDVKSFGGVTPLQSCFSVWICWPGRLQGHFILTGSFRS